MNVALLMLAAAVLAAAIAAYPPGLSLFYEPPHLTLDVPRHLVEQGYPRQIRVDGEYAYSRYGMDYGSLARDMFRQDGIYLDGRRIPPEECGGVLGGSPRIAPLKAALLAASFMILAAALLSGPGGGRRGEVREAREVAGVI